MQQLTCKLLWSFFFLLSEKEALILRKSWGKKSEKRDKVPKRFCPLVVAFSFSLIFSHRQENLLGGAPSTAKHFRSEIRNKSGNALETLSEQILNFQVSYGWRSPNPGK